MSIIGCGPAKTKHCGLRYRCRHTAFPPHGDKICFLQSFVVEHSIGNQTTHPSPIRLYTLFHGQIVGPSAILMNNSTEIHHSCGGWVWKRISEVAMQLLWSVTPVVLPTSSQPCTEISLVNFLQSLFPSTPEAEGSSFSAATIRSVELISFASPVQHDNEKLAAEVQYRNNTYILHFERPSDLKSVRKHYISFLWSAHGFTQDVVKLFLLGEPGARRAPGSKSEVKIYFNSSNTDDDKTLKLHDLGCILYALKRDYWWYFWLNSRIWTWPYTATKALFSKFRHAVVKIEIDGCDGPLSWAQASDILSRKCEGWKHAELRRYCEHIRVYFSRARMYEEIF